MRATAASEKLYRLPEIYDIVYKTNPIAFNTLKCLNFHTQR